MSAERLQKVLATAGIASRRDCEALISEGRVTVNGKVIRTLGTRVDPENDVIYVDGSPVKRPQPRTYVLLNKPTGVISTAEDTHDRPTVVELVNSESRLFPVGRLDQDSEGLLVLTDDGILTQRLTHPSYHVEKEYRALLDQTPDSEALREWREGVELDGVMTAPAWVDIQEKTDNGTWVGIVLQEGRKRQIREVAKLLGYNVLRLIRLREGSLTLGDLPTGQWRTLTEDEVEALWKHVGGRPDEANEEQAVAEEARRQRRSIVGNKRAARPGDEAAPERNSEEKESYGYRSRPQGEGFRSRDDQPQRDGGYRSRDDRPQRDGGFRSRPQGEGFRSRDDRPQREGGFRSRPQGEGFRSRDDRPQREGGYRPRPQGEGFRSRDDRPQREGGYRSRPQGEGFRSRDDRPQREGGYRSRPQGEGFRSRDDRPQRDGGYRSRPQGEGFRSRDDRPQRDGGYRSRPQGEGFRSRDDRPQREGGFRSRPQGEGFRSRDDRPQRDGGFRSRPQGEGFRSRDDRPQREGGFRSRPQGEGSRDERPQRDGDFRPRPRRDENDEF